MITEAKGFKIVTFATRQGQIDNEPSGIHYRFNEDPQNNPIHIVVPVRITCSDGYFILSQDRGGAIHNGVGAPSSLDEAVQNGWATAIDVPILLRIQRFSQDRGNQYTTALLNYPTVEDAMAKALELVNIDEGLRIKRMIKLEIVDTRSNLHKVVLTFKGKSTRIKRL